MDGFPRRIALSSGADYSGRFGYRRESAYACGLNCPSGVAGWEGLFCGVSLVGWVTLVRMVGCRFGLPWMVELY